VKRLPLVITLIIVLVAAGGYYLYQQFLKPKKITAWDLVPESTIFVYESNDCPECVEQLQQTSLWSVLRQAAFYEKPVDSLKLLFSFLETQPKGRLISGHLTRKDDFDFVFYIPLGQAKSKDLFLESLNKIKSTSRVLNGIQIYDMKSGNLEFSWALVDQIWIGSFTPFLVEDAIRTHTQGSGSSFRHQIAPVYQLPRIKEDAGNLYVHIRNFGNWLSIFSNSTPALVKNIGQSSLLDIKSDANNFTLNGFSLDSANQGFILSLFNNQVPVAFDLKSYVSNRAVLFTNYGISNGQKMHEALAQYAAKNNPRILDSVKLLNEVTGVELEKLYSTLGKEVGICSFESNGEALSQILLIQTTDSKEWINTFNAIAARTSIDTVFVEKFSDYDVREIPLKNFPEKLFWPLTTGFSTSYFTSLGNTVIVGENIEHLKAFLDDIDKEETWGKSVAQNQFLETTLLESNLSLYINTPLAWNIIERSLHPKWQEFLQEHQPELKSIGMGAIQMSHLNNTYYTNITWHFDEKLKTSKTPEPDRSNKLITNLTAGIYRFFVVRNHSTKKDEVLVQDSSKAISLIAADGKVQWKIELDQYIQGDVSQIDYYNNSKLQLFFATSGKLHIIDRLGKYVDNFPLTIQEKDIEFTSIVDYDHSKKYRFLVSGKSGKLWMYDKNGSNLEGWAPKVAGGSLFAAPQHHRIRGKDYILAVREDGIVHLMNRRGEMVRHFPLDLDARPVGDYFLEVGKNIETTNFVVVSRDGFRIKFNLEGKVQSRETLIKTQPDATFRLVREANDKQYLVVRQEARQLTVFDDNLKELLNSDFIGNNPTDVKFFDFGGGKRYITLTDHSQDLSFVYEARGKLITTLPLESNSLIIRTGSSEKPKAFYSLGGALTMQPL